MFMFYVKFRSLRMELPVGYLLCISNLNSFAGIPVLSDTHALRLSTDKLRFILIA